MTEGATSRQPAPPPVRPRIGVSSSLLGEQVRFNGGHSRSRFLTDELGRHVDWVPTCPLYDEIVVFIYDSTASVEHHELTRDALIKVPGIADVIIVSRPGVLAQGSSKPKAKG
jgi:hypothetical protein